MISSSSAPRRSSDARAFRFLLMCLSAWVAVRMVSTWDVALPAPPEAARAPWAKPAPFSIAMPAAAPPAMLGAPEPERTDRAPTPQRSRVTAIAAPFLRGDDANPLVVATPSGDGGADRHRLRLALMARLLRPTEGADAAIPARRGGWAPLPPQVAAVPGRAVPFWMNRQLGGWSLGGWLYVRGGSGRPAGTLASASQLGGSQAGLRLAHGFGDTGRTRAYARATVALQHSQQREIAFGLAFAPLAHWPVDVAVEQRVAIGREGRTAVAAMVSGGVSDVALPAGFRLDAYAQAGVVGARRRDGFADGAIVIDRHLGPDETSPLRLGGLAAAAVQPGTVRVDVGPRLTLRLPEVGQGSRIALDWRQRVVGAARPESGLALTLASDF